MNFMLGIVIIIGMLCFTLITMYLIYAIERYAAGKKMNDEDEEYGANS